MVILKDKLIITWWKPGLIYGWGSVFVLLGYKNEQITETNHCFTSYIFGVRIQYYTERVVGGC